jgi:hypothetical protein
MSKVFDENYFKSVNYVDYLSRSERYDKLADEIMTHLKVHDLDRGPILDFGCAVGMLVESLNKKGYKDVYGSDISEWALDQAKSRGLNVTNEPCYGTHHGVVFALDVLEHMSVKELDDFLSSIRTKTLVFRIPIRREQDDDYYLECSRADPTHIICLSKREWKTYLEEKGYFCLDLNLHTIYNSTGVYSGIALSKEFINSEFE